MATVRELQMLSNNVVICYNRLAKVLWKNQPVQKGFYSELFSYIKDLIAGLKTQPAEDTEASKLVRQFEDLLKQADSYDFRLELFTVIDIVSNYVVDIESV